MSYLTRPTSLIRLLEMLALCLEKLAESDYVLLDFEAAILVPYVLEKSGHAKDRIGAMYRDLMVQLSKPPAS